MARTSGVPRKKPLLAGVLAIALVAVPFTVRAQAFGEAVTRAMGSLSVGLAAGYLNADAEACAGDCSSRFQADARLSPALRAAISWTDNVSLELDFRYDLYDWEVDNASGEGSSSFHSYTVAAGIAYLFSPRSLGFLGEVQPLARAAVGYRFLDAGLDAPVRDYDPGFGAEVALGLRKGRWDGRLGYSYYRHAVGSRNSEATRAQTLVLDDVFVEVTYRLVSW